MTPTPAKSLIEVWKSYLDNGPGWRELVRGVEPRTSGCGILYEVPNALSRSGESLAIADMTDLAFAEPHYHPVGNLEIYIILEGSGLVVVGTTETLVKPGDSVVITPGLAHFTIPEPGLVLAAVNTPPFRPELYITVTRTDPSVKFDEVQFKRLAARESPSGA